MGCRLMVRLLDSARKCTKGCKDKEDALDLIAMEQFLTTLTPEACHTRVRVRQSNTSAEAGQLSEDLSEEGNCWRGTW